MEFGSAPVVGLDIGTSAVRAAQLSSGKSGRSLVKFGQVALPEGAIVDGEVRDPGAVSEAVAQLWKRSKIRSKKVVVGVANQRVVVRQVELPYLEEKEFKSSLKFQVADHIPMPVEDAELDYEILADYESEENGRQMKVLLVAAASDMVEQYVQTVSAAGLTPVGVDLTPFAVARAVSPIARGEVGSGGAEAVVDVGAGVTNILVHHNGEVQFVRILAAGGDDVTRAIAEHHDISYEEAEALKIDLGRGVGVPDTFQVIEEEVASFVAEVRGSIDYYLSQPESLPVSSVLLTGGGALTPGLANAMVNSLGLDVQLAGPLQDVKSSKSGLTAEQVAQVEPVVAAAMGLSMGVAGK
jgi:type IV pilus assembly protein PilM